MGCLASVPTAEVFLATPQAKPAEGYLAEGWPSKVMMTGWSFCGGHHAQSAGEEMIEEYMADSFEDIANLNQGGAGLSGEGQEEVLAICEPGGASLGSLHMPRHLSFGSFALLKDANGNVLAMLRTAQKKRPQGFSGSSYHVFAPRPQFEGQADAGVAKGMFLWATVTRAPASNTVQVVDGRGASIGKGYTYPGWVSSGLGAQKWKCENAGGQGIMLCLPTNETPKRHHVQCAQGVDVALQVCLMYAAKLATDEVYQPPPAPHDEHDDGGCD